LPAKLGMDEGENVVFMKNLAKYNENESFIFLFANGKGVRVPVTAYETKTNRKKLTGAYSSASPIAAVLFEEAAKDILILSSADRAILLSSELIPLKTTRSSQGSILFKLKGKQVIDRAYDSFEGRVANPGKYRKTKIPASGSLLDEKNPDVLQITLD